MLKGSLSPHLDTHNEEESFYVTLSNGPHVYVAESIGAETVNYSHDLQDIHFVTPILCKHCDDYIWGTGKVGVKCKGKKHFLLHVNLKNSRNRYKKIVSFVTSTKKPFNLNEALAFKLYLICNYT